MTGRRSKSLERLGAHNALGTHAEIFFVRPGFSARSRGRAPNFFPQNRFFSAIRRAGDLLKTFNNARARTDLNDGAVNCAGEISKVLPRMLPRQFLAP
jgi:hypothetical protein